MNSSSCCYMMTFRALVGRGVALAALLACLTPYVAPARDIDSELGVGKAINIFMRYGYLSICMRVVPRNDTDGWIFREPTVSVFRDAARLAAPLPRPAPAKGLIFDGDFHMEFCDNLKQLLQAYFRDFSFERLEKPWRAFTAGWPTDIMARNLGINSSFVSGEHCYVLVRVSRYRERAKWGPAGGAESWGAEEAVRTAMREAEVGDTVAIADFIRKYGSHYISSYVTGNSLYQVFVYSRSVYARIKDRLKTRGVSDLSNSELSNFFSPWYAEHIGQIKVASGNKTVDAWASRKLKVHYYIFAYPSLLKLYGEPALLRALDSLLGNEALLQLELKTLAPLFQDPTKRDWFDEVIDNFLKLWESNM